MSGGHYDYIQHKMRDVADQIWCEANSEEFIYSDETKDKFMAAVLRLRLAATLVGRIDYLMSGDDGEESFHKRLHEDIAKIWGANL